jgi:pimeloyl-ACP methyl ester carboxylesterase
MVGVRDCQRRIQRGRQIGWNIKDIPISALHLRFSGIEAIEWVQKSIPRDWHVILPDTDGHGWSTRPKVVVHGRRIQAVGN